MAIAKALPRDLDQASFCQEAVASRAGWLGDALRQRSQPEEDDAMQMQCINVQRMAAALFPAGRPDKAEYFDPSLYDPGEL